MQLYVLPHIDRELVKFEMDRDVGRAFGELLRFIRDEPDRGLLIEEIPPNIAIEGIVREIHRIRSVRGPRFAYYPIAASDEFSYSRAAVALYGWARTPPDINVPLLSLLAVGVIPLTNDDESAVVAAFQQKRFRVLLHESAFFLGRMPERPKSREFRDRGIPLRSSDPSGPRRVRRPRGRKAPSDSDSIQPLSSVDTYLESVFDFIQSEPTSGEVEETVPERCSSLPMLLRVNNNQWSTEAREYEERFRVGNIVACTGTSETLRQLSADTNVVAIEASRQVAAEGDCAESIPFVRAPLVHGKPYEERGDRAIVAVVDDGIDILHEAFLDSKKKSRILGVWHQSASMGQRPRGFNFGRFYDHRELQRLIAKGKQLPSTPPGDGQHGTHVASIAAGRATSQFFGGVAPDAKLLVVISHLAVSANDPRSLGYSQSHIAALQFIRDFAIGRRMPVVVNVSQGMNAGAHDGTSLLEAGFDTITEGGRLPGFVIVKSAGNERTWPGHAKLIAQSQQADTLNWLSSSVDRKEDHVELWFSACDELRFRLVDPTGEKSDWVGAPLSNWKTLTKTRHLYGTGNRGELLFTRYHHDNGDSRLLVLVRRGTGISIEAGNWHLEIESREVRSDGVVHAWIEKHARRPIGFSSHANEDWTLSIPATADSVISVGSVNTAPVATVASYSSYGPTRDGRRKPDLAAPGEGISAAAAGTVFSVESNSGTSMSAAHVTGAVALLLSRREKVRGKEPQFNAAQVRAALRHTAIAFNGQWGPGRGYGLLDAHALATHLT